MEREKGLLVMVDALRRLVNDGEDVVLDLVGWSPKSDAALNEVFRLAEAPGVRSRIFYHGYRPLGPALFAFYRKADIYLSASFTEGFPRSLWEAMAHSLPIVATSVGSIPHVLQHRRSAILVEPRDSAALAGGARLVIRNGRLRQKLIRTARNRAARNTLDVTAMDLVSKLQTWIASKAS